MEDKKMTCFEIHARDKTRCGKASCKYFLEKAASHNNCTLNAAENPQTLETVGELLDLSRMRVCKVEKIVRTKCRELLQYQDEV